MKIVGTYLNERQREQFQRNWQKVEQKRKAGSAKTDFSKIFAKVLRRISSAK